MTIIVKYGELLIIFQSIMKIRSRSMLFVEELINKDIE